MLCLVCCYLGVPANSEYLRKSFIVSEPWRSCNVWRSVMREDMRRKMQGCCRPQGGRTGASRRHMSDSLALRGTLRQYESDDRGVNTTFAWKQRPFLFSSASKNWDIGFTEHIGQTLIRVMPIKVRRKKPFLCIYVSSVQYVLFVHAHLTIKLACLSAEQLLLWLQAQ